MVALEYFIVSNDALYLWHQLKHYSSKIVQQLETANSSAWYQEQRASYPSTTAHYITPVMDKDH